MKKRWLGLFLLAMVSCTLLPVTALVAGTQCAEGDGCAVHEAAIGSAHYDTLQEAIADAQSGEKVVLLKDVQDVGDVILEKSLTLDLASHRLTLADGKKF